MATTIVNPLPGFSKKLNWWENFVFSKLFGTNWTTTLWAKLVDTAKAFLATGAPADVAALETYINSNFTKIVDELDGHNAFVDELAGLGEAAFEMLVGNYLSELLAAAQAEVGP